MRLWRSRATEWQVLALVLPASLRPAECRIFAELLESHCIIHQLPELANLSWVVDLRSTLIAVLILSTN